MSHLNKINKQKQRVSQYFNKLLEYFFILKYYFIVHYNFKLFRINQKIQKLNLIDFMKMIPSNKFQVTLPSKDKKKINSPNQTYTQTQRIVDSKKIENQHTKRVKIGSTLIP